MPRALPAGSRGRRARGAAARQHARAAARRWRRCAHAGGDRGRRCVGDADRRAVLHRAGGGSAQVQAPACARGVAGACAACSACVALQRCAATRTPVLSTKQTRVPWATCARLARACLWQYLRCCPHLPTLRWPQRPLMLASACHCAAASGAREPAGALAPAQQGALWRADVRQPARAVQRAAPRSRRAALRAPGGPRLGVRAREQRQGGAACGGLCVWCGRRVEPLCCVLSHAV